MVNSRVEIYSYSHTKCSTGLSLWFFLNEIIKSDFALLKSENGINFFLMRQNSHALPAGSINYLYY
jgi:hypothetical protein